MKTLLKLLGAVGTLGAIVAGVAASCRTRTPAAAEVFTEKIQRRDLEAVVRESGKVRAKTSVPLSSQTTGQVLDVLAREGDRVKAGQLLIQIDPKPFESAIAQAEASLRDIETRLIISQTQLETRRRKLDREKGLGPATSREKLEELQADVEVATSEVEAARLRVDIERSRVEKEKHDLLKVRITAPIDGVIVRCNVEKGQTVVGGMNQSGSELMTLADLSALQVEVEVGEGAILEVKPGNECRVEIDALPNRKFNGKVTEVGTSPLAAAPGTERGVAFRVVITLDETIEGVRPGFSASAEIVTATRKGAVAVPIRALVSRDSFVDEKDRPITGPPPAGAKRKSLEGPVILRDGKAEFRAIKVGISGREHFEVLEGLAEGDEVVTGPHKSLKDLKDGDLVQRRPE